MTKTYYSSVNNGNYIDFKIPIDAHILKFEYYGTDLMNGIEKYRIDIESECSNNETKIARYYCYYHDHEKPPPNELVIYEDFSECVDCDCSIVFKEFIIK